jgi:Zn-dependent metalloprotease
MNFSHFALSRPLKAILVVFSLLTTACGGGSAPTPKPPITPEPEPPVITKVPVNQISHAYFLDEDKDQQEISGKVTLKTSDIDDNPSKKVESVWVFWADSQGNKLGDAWLKTNKSSVYDITISNGSNIPKNASALLLYPSNSIGQAQNATLVPFNDFISNAELTGPGGNENEYWAYGNERPKLSIQRSTQQEGFCTFDNGLVSVINMNNTKDTTWENRADKQQSNVADDAAFPPYSFLCDELPEHSSDQISDEYGVWTYSTLNDTMFYGTIVYNTFVKYLGEPPLAEKIRLRVHYGNQIDASAYWDGAYANFGDAYPFYYSMAPLDAIAHEVGHGVLSRLTNIGSFERDISLDARSLHEAFADIAGLMAKYEFSGHTRNWIHGENFHGFARRLDQIKTENGAIDSYLDYDDAGNNYYLRIGMMTYPFYLLSNKWGIEAAYSVYINSAKTCWDDTPTIPEAAQCIKEYAANMGLNQQDVIDAFKTVKIKLFDDGVLSHFTNQQTKLLVEFTDNSQSTNQVSQWAWNFGDGSTSTVQNPIHTYTELGEYAVTLDVTDQSDNTDSFQRTIYVTDKYCAIRAADTDNQLTNVTIGNIDINYDPTLWDYAETPINLINPNNTKLVLTGNNNSTPRSTTWKVWIDLNDNGIFGDTPNEVILEKYQAQGLPYALDTTIDLSNLPNDGLPKYMRILGDYAAITPCSSSVGEALDLRVAW